MYRHVYNKGVTGGTEGDILGKLPNPPQMPGGGSKSLSSLLIYSKAVNRKGLATGSEALPVNGSSGTKQKQDRNLFQPTPF